MEHETVAVGHADKKAINYGMKQNFLAIDVLRATFYFSFIPQHSAGCAH